MELFFSAVELVICCEEKISVSSEQPTLVWANSAQMMQPYLPLDVALPVEIVVFT